MYLSTEKVLEKSWKIVCEKGYEPWVRSGRVDYSNNWTSPWSLFPGYIACIAGLTP